MSWEQRRQEWKESPPDDEKIDEWFEDLSVEERKDAFFESQSFVILVEHFQKNLHTLFEHTRVSHPSFFRYEPTVRLVSYCFGKIVLKTPELRDCLHNNENVAVLVQNKESEIMRRMYAICTYEPKKKPGIPEFVYNLDIPWKWEETAIEIAGY